MVFAAEFSETCQRFDIKKYPESMKTAFFRFSDIGSLQENFLKPSTVSYQKIGANENSVLQGSKIGVPTGKFSETLVNQSVCFQNWKKITDVTKGSNVVMSIRSSF